MMVSFFSVWCDICWLQEAFHSASVIRVRMACRKRDQKALRRKGISIFGKTAGWDFVPLNFIYP